MKITSISCTAEDETIITFPIVHCKLPYIYHTTTVYNEKSKYSEIWEGIPTPAFGDFHKTLHDGKSFTISQESDYSSPWMGTDEKFLRYQPLRAFALVDCRSFNDTMWREFYKSQDLLYQHCPFIDGYMKKDDAIDIHLRHPQDCVNPDFDLLEFANNKGLDYKLQYQKESALVNGL